MISSKGDTKMSWRRAKSAGWAAFDLQQRQKDVPGCRTDNEPFPSLSSTMIPLQPLETFSKNNHLSVKPFSSVILPSADFPSVLDDNVQSKSSEVGSSDGPKSSDIPWEDKFGPVFRQLNELYNWADDSLVQDVMAAVCNDFHRASSFLKAMISDEILEEHNDTKVVQSSCDSEELLSDGKTSHRKSDVCEDDKNMRNVLGFGDDGHMDMNARPGQLTCVPVEPEWEDDDIYSSYRKDAIKMMRNATRHSKAATNSFLRGDHFSAQQFSLRAREEWAAAQRLNSNAAREILRVRNENNGIWRLDLHGLHAAEAIQALQERLHMIETQVLFKGSIPSGLVNSLRNKEEAFSASSSGGCNNNEKSVERMFHRQKPIWLEVITGIGNHSLGVPALPAAVKTFLLGNGYRFDEARPGVILVRPKFGRG